MYYPRSRHLINYNALDAMLYTSLSLYKITEKCKGIQKAFQCDGKYSIFSYFKTTTSYKHFIAVFKIEQIYSKFHTGHRKQ